ncbi:MAG: DUF4136 domain-containing protein [Myxococcota bacterium]|nr:DUF4136 domain-containing protein [Myxococcota bacterium]
MTRALILSAALFLVAGCQTQYRGDVSYDPDALYRGYQTFSWVEGQGGSEQPVRALAEKAVQAELVKDGLTYVENGEPDLLVRVNLGRRRRTSLSGATGPRAEAVGMEVILQDRKTGQWVWNGWAVKTYSSDLEAETEIPLALAEIFKDFPPTQ